MSHVTTLRARELNICRVLHRTLHLTLQSHPCGICATGRGGLLRDSDLGKFGDTINWSGITTETQNMRLGDVETGFGMLTLVVEGTERHLKTSSVTKVYGDVVSVSRDDSGG